MVMKKIMFNDRVAPMTYYVIDGLKTQTRRLVSGVSGRKGARLKLVLGKIRHNIHVWAQGRYYGIAWAGLFCDEVSEMSEGEYYLRFDDDTCLKVKSQYKEGEVVGVAQCYSDLFLYEVFHLKRKSKKIDIDDILKSPGYRNKLFVRADLMRYYIKITGVRVEYLQDISDKDIFAEGFFCKDEFFKTFKRLYGAKVWETNPLVFVYDFERYDNAADIYK